MTKKQLLKREQQRRFWAVKKAAGWVCLGLIIPPVVKDKILECKREAMAHYRLEHPRTIK